MKDVSIEEAHDVCRSIAHKHGANFSVGFRFLPPLKRRAVYAAYAACRIADDIADSPGATIEGLDEWQKEIEDCYAGTPTHPVTIALHDSLRHFAIPKDAFFALIEGCRQDQVKTRYANFDELLHYCDLVATSISDISLSIFGYKTPDALVHGKSLSTALQLTNVTRDVGDDLDRDRIYIPATELAEFGIRESDLFERKETPAMRALIVSQIDRAESYFRKAEPLLRELDFDARFPTLLMGGVYSTVLRKLRGDPFVVLRRRLSLSTAQKVGVVLSRLVRPHFV